MGTWPRQRIGHTVRFTVASNWGWYAAAWGTSEPALMAGATYRIGDGGVGVSLVIVGHAWLCPTYMLTE